MVVAGILN